MSPTVGVGWRAGSLHRVVRKGLRAEPEGSAKWGMGHFRLREQQVQKPCGSDVHGNVHNSKKAMVARAKWVRKEDHREILKKEVQIMYSNVGVL